jgi:hypothetical protein
MMTITTTPRLFATGATILTIPTHVLLTAITDRNGLRVASLLARDRGTAGAGVTAAITVDVTGTVIVAIAVAMETVGSVAVTDIAVTKVVARTQAAVGMVVASKAAAHLT